MREVTIWHGSGRITMYEDEITDWLLGQLAQGINVVILKIEVLPCR